MRAIIILGVLAVAMLAVPAVAAKAPSCNGFWYYDEQVGPVGVHTDGNPDCTGADVYLPPVEQCITEGAYHKLRSVGPVTVWEYRCG